MHPKQYLISTTYQQEVRSPHVFFSRTKTWNQLITKKRVRRRVIFEGNELLMTNKTKLKHTLNVLYRLSDSYSYSQMTQRWCERNMSLTDFCLSFCSRVVQVLSERLRLSGYIYIMCLWCDCIIYGGVLLKHLKEKRGTWRERFA